MAATLPFVSKSDPARGEVGPLKPRRQGSVWVSHRIPGEAAVLLSVHMCFAMFIATGSFFLGQMRLFPEPLRLFPLMAIPAFLPLVLMVYWLRLRKPSPRVKPLAAAPSV